MKEDGHILNLIQMIEISHSLKYKEFINNGEKYFPLEKME